MPLIAKSPRYFIVFIFEKPLKQDVKNTAHDFRRQDLDEMVEMVQSD